MRPLTHRTSSSAWPFHKLPRIAQADGGEAVRQCRHWAAYELGLRLRDFREHALGILPVQRVLSVDLCARLAVTERLLQLQARLDGLSVLLIRMDALATVPLLPGRLRYRPEGRRSMAARHTACYPDIDGAADDASRAAIRATSNTAERTTCATVVDATGVPA